MDVTIVLLSLKEGAEIEAATGCNCDTDSDHACDCYSGNAS